MSESEKVKIADAADMIVGGYAYARFKDNIRVVNLNKCEKWSEDSDYRFYDK